MRQAVWTAVGLSRDTPAGSAAGVVIEGREWALWRGISGRAHLWEDRCPHRGMRMSLGFVRGDRLGCLYHGWQYDETGQCRRIPAHPDLEPPATIRIRGRPVVESGGVIWACFADEAPPAPDFAGAVPVRSLFLDAPLAEARAALGRAEAAPGVADAVIFERGADRWLIAGHVVEAGRCALHIAAFGGAESVRRAARWASALRYEPALAEATA